MILKQIDYTEAHKIGPDATDRENFEASIKAVYKAAKETARLAEAIGNGEAFNAESARFAVDSLVLSHREYYKYALASGGSNENAPVPTGRYGVFKEECLKQIKA